MDTYRIVALSSVISIQGPIKSRNECGLAISCVSETHYVLSAAFNAVPLDLQENRKWWPQNL